MPTSNFRLAPMDWTNWVVSLVVMACPVVAAVIAWAAGADDDLRPGSWGGRLLGVAAVPAFFILLFGIIWLFLRPSSFLLSPQGVRLRWPARTDLVPLHDIAGGELITLQAFKRRYRRPIRIGAGGFLGAFGLLNCRETTFRMYISRVDRFVLVFTRRSRPLMITPERPEQFVRTINGLIQSREEVGP